MKSLNPFSRVFATVGLALLGPALLAGCKPAPKAAAKAAAPPIEVHVVQPIRGPITRFVTLPGEVKPYQQATLYAKIAGYLKTITVDKGDQIKAGAVVAETEVPELVAERAKYRAEAEVTEMDYKRLSESQKQAPDLVVAQTVDGARGKRDVAKAELDRIETLLNYTRITAPFAGVITRRFVDPGAFIPAATMASTPQSAAIVTLTDFNRVRVQVAVPELEAALVTTDEPVKLSVEGLPGRTFEAKVTRFSFALDEANKTMLCEIEMPNPKWELRPGMYATVKIGIEHKENALLVPADAVVTEKSGSSVFVLEEGKAKKTRIQPGFRDGVNVEIASGLKPDQTVIRAGKQPLTDGQAVKLREDP